MSPEPNLESAPAASPLRIGIVPGVTPDKWTRRWSQQHPDIPFTIVPVSDPDARAALDTGLVTVCFARLPIENDGLSVIRLYRETAVIVVSRDSVVATEEQLRLAQVAALSGVVDYPPGASVADAVASVAAGVGALRLPASVARMTRRRDVVAIPIVDAADTEIALCWLTDETTELIDEFVGIVRGRTAASSRGAPSVTKRARRRGR